MFCHSIVAIFGSVYFILYSFGVHRFFRRLVEFYKPISKQFSCIELGQSITRPSEIQHYSVIGCQLIDFLLACDEVSLYIKLGQSITRPSEIQHYSVIGCQLIDFLLACDEVSWCIDMGQSITRPSEMQHFSLVVNREEFHMYPLPYVCTGNNLIFNFGLYKTKNGINSSIN